MAIYTVLVPRHLVDVVDRADRTAFVRDGFSGWAFLLGPFFLLRHRAWIAAAAWLVLVLAGAWFARLMHLPPAADLVLLAVLAVFLGLEGNDLRRGALERRGFDLAGIAAGRSRQDAEQAFFRAEPAPMPVTLPPNPPRRGRQPSGAGVIGSFPDVEG